MTFGGSKSKQLDVYGSSESVSLKGTMPVSYLGNLIFRPRIYH